MDPRYLVSNASDLPTPALLFYEDIIRGNIGEAIRIAGAPGRLRPHVKTHKTAEIASMCMRAGIDRFKCATVAEAEMLAKAGARDVLLAFPLYGRNARRFATLAARHPATAFSTIVDAPEGLACISRAAAAEGTTIGIFLDLDVGQHRTGIDPGPEAIGLYRSIAACPGLRQAGIHCYDGHNHQDSADERRKAAADCYASMAGVRDPLLSSGEPVPEVVMGGTPTFPFHARMPDVSLSPGTVFLQDRSYASSFADMEFVPAALILAQVVSRSAARGQFCIDLGYKAVSADPKGVRGEILNLHGAEPGLQNEEHWVFRMREGGLPEPGSPVYVLPTHICPTVALYERAYVVNGEGRCCAEWRIAGRDRVTGV